MTHEQAVEHGLRPAIVQDGPVVGNRVHIRLVLGGLSHDPRERAVQLGLAPESGPIDFEIFYRNRDTALLQALTMRAMRWLERRFFASYPLPAGVHRGTVLRVPGEQVELARARMTAAGLSVAAVQ